MTSNLDVICLSHLAWDFVYQRPQHLMSRFATTGRVFYIEETKLTTGRARLERHRDACGVEVITPHVPETVNVDEGTYSLIRELLRKEKLDSYCLWYYTPMPVMWAQHLKPKAIIYDCMDELSAFKNAPLELKKREAELLRQADLVFTGGQSLFESKRSLHSSVYAFPSSIDVSHFAQARMGKQDPEDQAAIPHPRLGFFGVIDERMDLELLSGLATARPDWQIVMIGPIVKIDPKILPANPNIHYLGMKSYTELPKYISGWDIAILPFARNESTRFISPTKTLEYLAAGRPVISTSIRDVVQPYGEAGVVSIADECVDFILATERELQHRFAEKQKKVDALLSGTSWNRTWRRMMELVENVIHRQELAERRSQSLSVAPMVAARSVAAGGF